MFFVEYNPNKDYRKINDQKNGMHLIRVLEEKHDLKKEVTNLVYDSYRKRLKFSDPMLFDFYILESEKQLKSYFEVNSQIDFDLFIMKLNYNKERHSTSIVFERKYIWNVPISKILKLLKPDS